MTEDVFEGAQPLPWIVPSLVGDNSNLTWTSSWNTRTLRPNRNLSFCPGAIIEGAAQPFVVGPRAVNSSFCQSILLSIANLRVYYGALHTGSDSDKKFGLHTFPKSVLRQLETVPEGQWLSSFLFPVNATSGDSVARLH